MREATCWTWRGAPEIPRMRCALSIREIARRTGHDRQPVHWATRSDAGSATRAQVDEILDELDKPRGVRFAAMSRERQLRWLGSSFNERGGRSLARRPRVDWLRSVVALAAAPFAKEGFRWDLRSADLWIRVLRTRYVANA